MIIMEKYEDFEIEIVQFANIDVISASSDIDTEWGDEPFDD